MSRPPAHRRTLQGAALIVLLALPLSAWTHSQYPSIQAIASRPDNAMGDWLMMATFGMLRTRDGGKTAGWICEAAYAPDNSNFDATASALPDGSWLATTDGRAFISKNDGCSWQTMPGLPADSFLYGIWQDKTPPRSLWAALVVGGTQHRIARRPAAGGDWQTVWTSDELHVQRVQVGYGRMAALALKPGASGALLLTSDDGGKTVNEQNVAKVEGSLFLAPLHPTSGEQLVIRAAATGAKHSIWRSVDAGKTWHQTLQLKPKHDLLAATWVPGAVTPTLLAGGLLGGLWRSTDEGASFKKVKGAPEVGCFQHPDGLLLACTNNYYDFAALMRSDDAGLTWQPLTCFNQITGPMTCANKSIEKLCASEWPILKKEKLIYPGLACDAPAPMDAGGDGDTSGGDVAPPPPDPGDEDCCQSGPTSAGGSMPIWLLVLTLIALFVRRMGGTGAQGSGTEG